MTTPFKSIAVRRNSPASSGSRGKNGFLPTSPTQTAGSLHQQRLGEVWRIVRENQRLQGTPPVPPPPGPGGGAEGQ